MTNEEYPSCRTCGSNNIVAEACVEWDRKTASWTVALIYDKGAFCSDCETATRLTWTSDQREGASSVSALTAKTRP